MNSFYEISITPISDPFGVVKDQILQRDIINDISFDGVINN
jgi:hypothetical protein